ncbi:MAG: hypothetical protein ACJAUP_003710 [Cellvibrionaceae bacterium]|jgi:hypothetical protein
MSDLQHLPRRVILLSDLSKFDYLEKAIVESLEQALYRLEVVLGGHVYHVNEKPGKTLTRRSIVEIQSLLTPYKIHQMYLRHLSSYDEMIGHDINTGSNELLVPLGNFFAEVEAGKDKSTQH